MLVLLVLHYVLRTQASSFLITDHHYIQSFAEGIRELKMSAKNDHALRYQNRTLPGRLSYDAHEYDFVVVGAGTSGAIVARRLSEVPEWKILLLEAGDVETPYTQIPAMTPYLHRTKYNWGYTTVPQKTFCLGTKEKRCSCSVGKALGGSTVINRMAYVRGNKRDYDTWADQGNEGWCYEDVLPYFKKSENARLRHFDSKHHSQAGPVQVENPQHVTYATDVLLDAADELGLRNRDYNGKDQMGYSQVQVVTKRGKRLSTAQAYLNPIQDRPNLTIRPLSQVVEVIINPHTKEAVGVKYLHDDQLRVATASKEVILSAGAFNTPQLLMLSGVGPKDELHKHEIPLVRDLAVGKHLRDHVAFAGLYYVVNGSHHVSDAEQDLIQWLKQGTGLLSSTPFEGIGFVKTKASKNQAHYPDVELTLAPLPYYDSTNECLNWRITDELRDDFYRPLEGRDVLQILVSVMRPKSLGTVSLQSKNPLEWPLIDPNQFSDPDDDDINTIIEGINEAIALTKTHAFGKLHGHLYEKPVLGCADYEFGSKNYWKCAVRHLSRGLQNHSGTCKMGSITDQNAVVDNKLNVHGVHKLRVADASVIPVSITGDLQAPAMMVGEKAADLIKNYWK